MTIARLIFAKNVISDNHTFESSQLAAQPAQLQRYISFCAAHPHAHDRRAGEEIFWAELRHWTTGGISPPQLCLTVRAECLRGAMSDRLRARPAVDERRGHRAQRPRVPARSPTFVQRRTWPTLLHKPPTSGNSTDSYCILASHNLVLG